jgi:hypothetical protein
MRRSANLRAARREKASAKGQEMSAQRFPAGADVRRGPCDGLWCLTKSDQDVVPARVGPSWRQALAMDLCANCLADFAVAGNVILEAHVYVLAADGLFHEVKGDVMTTELADP